MKKLLISLFLIAETVFVSSYACTNFLVGKNASTTGSTFISYAADSYFLFGALAFRPAADHAPGELVDVHDWDTGKYMGKIKQVAHTYSVVGNMERIPGLDRRNYLRRTGGTGGYYLDNGLWNADLHSFAMCQNSP